jgi:hypothetical protein
MILTARVLKGSQIIPFHGLDILYSSFKSMPQRSGGGSRRRSLGRLSASSETSGRLMLTIPAYDNVYLISICHEKVCIKAGVSSTAPANKVVGGITLGRMWTFREQAREALPSEEMALVLFKS